MGNILIAYYSFEGHTEKVAETIADELRASGAEPTLLKIAVRKEPPKSGMKKFLVGGFNALTQGDPGILNEDIDINAYDRIFLGTPVWAGNAPGAIKAFLKKAKPEGRKFYLFAMSGGGEEKKTFQTITEYLKGNEIVKTISLKQGGSLDGLKEFCRDESDDSADADASAETGASADRTVSKELLQQVEDYLAEVYEEPYMDVMEEAEDVCYSAPSAPAPSAARPPEERQAAAFGPPASGASSGAMLRETESAYAPMLQEARQARPAGVYGHAVADSMAFELDESFSDYLFRKIDERGMKDSDCYKKANVSKQIFSNIKSNPEYIPSKTTILAFAIALQMDLEETKDLLERAGYALSHSSKLDVIVEFFIKNKKYDLFEINNTLFQYDQKLLGSR
ncbi:MAG: NAD(P)H-dependent oxidoreductase [Lachnospiraceae bacterium]|nr:NAD(P)H-dependent oxidoreductase [Lachnospiraceae bacterium]